MSIVSLLLIIVSLLLITVSLIIIVLLILRITQVTSIELKSMPLRRKWTFAQPILIHWPNVIHNHAKNIYSPIKQLP
jgi:energy-coupling factor transporter transmembrane protein EcfT